MLRRFLIVLLLSTAACSALHTAVPAATATPSSGRTATLHALVNLVFERDSDADSFTVPVDGQTVPEHGTVRTGVASQARLDLIGGSSVRLGGNTQVVIDQLGGAASDPLTGLTLSRGQLWVSLAGGQLDAQTPLGAATVRGSYAEFEYSTGTNANGAPADVLTIMCIEGECAFKNGSSQVAFGTLQVLIVTNGGQSIAGPTPLPTSAVSDFLANSPESSGVVLTLTAAAASSSTPTPTATPTPNGSSAPSSSTSASGTSASSDTPLPSATPAPNDTDTVTPAPTESATPTGTETPRPVATRVRPPTLPPTPTELPTETDTLAPTATNTPGLQPHPHPQPTNTPVPAPTPAPTAAPTNPPPPTAKPTRPPPPTKTKAAPE